MIAPDDKRMISGAVEAARRDAGAPPASTRQQPGHSSANNPSLPRASTHAPRRDFRDDRVSDSYVPTAGTSGSLASRLGDPGLPPRPTTFDHSRDGDRSDLEGQRKRPASGA